MVLKSADGSRGAVTVILRDTQAADARVVATSIEAVTRAFADDCGGFSHLELSLCPWQKDVTAVTSVADVARNRVLELAASEDVPSNMFRRFADSVNQPRRNVVSLRSFEQRPV